MSRATLTFTRTGRPLPRSSATFWPAQMLDTEYGLGYEDECLAVSLAYRRKFTVDVAQGVPPSTSVVLRFSLKTGDQPVQPFSLFPRNVFNTAHP